MARGELKHNPQDFDKEHPLGSDFDGNIFTIRYLVGSKKQLIIYKNGYPFKLTDRAFDFPELKLVPKIVQVPEPEPLDPADLELLEQYNSGELIIGEAGVFSDGAGITVLSELQLKELILRVQKAITPMHADPRQRKMLSRAFFAWILTDRPLYWHLVTSIKLMANDAPEVRFATALQLAYQAWEGTKPVDDRLDWLELAKKFIEQLALKNRSTWREGARFVVADTSNAHDPGDQKRLALREKHGVAGERHYVQINNQPEGQDVQ